MQRLKPPVLLAIVSILLLILGITWWPRGEIIPGTPLSVAQINSCPEVDLVDLVSGRLSQRANQSPAGWRRLPQAAQVVYSIEFFTLSCTRYGLADQAVACGAFPDSPNPDEIAEAFRSLKLEEVARILDTMGSRMRAAEPAFAAWIAYRNAGEGASPIPPNPFSDLDARLHTALGTASIDAALRAYIRMHADTIADP